MADVTIFGVPQSSYVWSARMTLEENGIAYDLEARDWKQPEYRALHPFARMPAFRNGDLTLYETAAVMNYVDGVLGQGALTPSDGVERARMIQWMSAINDYFYGDIVRGCVLEYVFPSGPDGQPDRRKIETGLEAARHHFDVADEALAQTSCLAGGALSLADILLAPIVFYAAGLPEGGPLMAERKNLGRWFAELSARPSFKATVPPPPQS